METEAHSLDQKIKDAIAEVDRADKRYKELIIEIARASMTLQQKQADLNKLLLDRDQKQTEVTEKISKINEAIQLELDKLSQKIKLDVGGTLFSTSKDTLLAQPESYFSTMLSSGKWKPQEDGSYFIDRNPEHFKVILEFLRTGIWNTQGMNQQQIEALENEASFYHVSLPGTSTNSINNTNSSTSTTVERRSSMSSAISNNTSSNNTGANNNIDINNNNNNNNINNSPNSGKDKDNSENNSPGLFGFLGNLLKAEKSPVILNKDNKGIKRIKEWLPEDKKIGELIYQASKDGFLAKNFHEKCDNQGPTLIVIRSKEGFVFGGYASSSWNSWPNGTWVKATGSFLFSITNKQERRPTKFPLKAGSEAGALYSHASYGACFGNDLGIHDNANNFEISLTFPYYYEDTTGFGLDLFRDSNNKSTVQDIQIFKIV